MAATLGTTIGLALRRYGSGRPTPAAPTAPAAKTNQPAATPQASTTPASADTPPSASPGNTTTTKAKSSSPATSSSTPTAPPPSTNTPANFQPAAPYYAAFFYPWFRNPATDGGWSGSTWDDPDNLGSHSPPTNWFSNYLPDLDPSVFSPSSELYSSNDYTTFKWQMSKLKEAKQEVAIASWWGQGHKTDSTFNTILGSFMGRSDNPYPHLRWALYYEKEGNVVGGTSNPSAATIAGDLNYLTAHYASSPYMLKVGGKPVVFVYADGSDGAGMAQRWHDANAQTGNAFYIVLKVYSGYASDPNQPDSWHQYGPAAREDSQGSYSYTVSPGFWRSGDSPLLARDVSAFQTAVTHMVSSSATWRLVTTWNEWGEGSAVEPGTEVIQANGSTPAVINPSGTTFGNAYVQALADRLPSLE